MAVSLLRVMTNGLGYRTIPLKDGMLASDVESQLIKGLGKTNRDVDFSAYRLYHVPDGKGTSSSSLYPGEVLFDKNDDVAKYSKNAPPGQYWFKLPNQGGGAEEEEAVSPRKPAKKKKEKDTASPAVGGAKKGEAANRLAGVFDVSFGPLSKTTKAHAAKENRPIWIHFRDKAPVQYTFDAANGWDYHIHQIYLRFELSEENPSSFILQDQASGRIMRSVADVQAAAGAHASGKEQSRVDRIIFRLNPEFEVERLMKRITSADGVEKRSALKKLCSLIESDPIYLGIAQRHGGGRIVLELVEQYAANPPDTVGLALAVLEGVVANPEHNLTLERKQLECVVAILVDDALVGSCRINAARVLVGMFSARASEAHCELLLSALEKYSQRAEERAEEPQEGSGALAPLLRVFLESVKMDPLLAWTVFEIMLGACSHAPLASALAPSQAHSEAAQRRTREDLMLEVRQCAGVVDVLHSTALQPGRTEVEAVLLQFQQCYLRISFHEKTIAYDKGNADHQHRLEALWHAAIPDQPLEALVSSKWKSIGFQSDDPTRDFRAMGILGLRHLLYFAETDDTVFQNMCSDMESRESNYYPIATAGMCISQMLDSVLEKLAKRKVLPLLFDGVNPIEQMYVVLFKRLHALFDERNADYMAFNEIRGELEKLLEQYAEVSTSVQQFSRKLFSYDVNQDKDDAAHVSTIRTTAVYQWGSGVSVPTVERLGVLMSKPVLFIAASSHCVVVTKTDEVWGWGSAGCGQLGIENPPRKVEEPVLVQSLCGKQIVKVFVSDGRTAAVSNVGELWMCGEQLPARDGAETKSVLPQRVAMDFGNEVLSVKKVAFGKSHGVLLVKADRVGKVFTWGRNSFHQLGHSEKDAAVDWPLHVSGLSHANVLDISAGAYHTMAYTADKDLYAWGQNHAKEESGRKSILGTKEKDKATVERPSRVKALRIVKLSGGVHEVSCGQSHTVILSKRGVVYTWGLGKKGRLGHGDEEDHLKPKEVAGLEHIVHVMAGYGYTLAVGRSGKLYSWGEGGRGSLGNGTLADVHAPKEVLVSGRSVVCDVMCASEAGVNLAALQFELPSESGSVFGVPLGKLMRQSPDREGGKVPYIVQTLCAHVLREGSEVRGGLLDGLSGTVSPEVRLLKHRFESTSKVDMSGVSAATSARLLLHWVEELPSPILPKATVDEMVDTAQHVGDAALRCAVLGHLLHRRSNPAQATVFLHLVDLFAALARDPAVHFSQADFSTAMWVVCGAHSSGSRTSKSSPAMGASSHASIHGNLSTTASSSTASLGDADAAYAALFDCLREDVPILRHPVFVELLHMCATEPGSPLHGAELRALWDGLIVVGLPASLQSRLLWRLKECESVLDHKCSIGGGDAGDAPSLEGAVARLEALGPGKEHANPTEYVQQGIAELELASAAMHTAVQDAVQANKEPPISVRSVLEELAEYLQHRLAEGQRRKERRALRQQLEEVLEHLSIRCEGADGEDERAPAHAQAKAQQPHASPRGEASPRGLDAQTPELLSASFERATVNLHRHQERERHELAAMRKSLATLKDVWAEADPLENEVFQSLRDLIEHKLLPFFSAFREHMEAHFWNDNDDGEDEPTRLLVERVSAVCTFAANLFNYVRSRQRVAEVSIKNLAEAGIVDESMNAVVKDLQTSQDAVVALADELVETLKEYLASATSGALAHSAPAIRKQDEMLKRNIPVLMMQKQASSTGVKNRLVRSRSKTMEKRQTARPARPNMTSENSSSRLPVPMMGRRISEKIVEN